MSARERLGIAGAACSSPAWNANSPEILDLSVNSQADQPDHLTWRIRVAVPLAKDENVTLNGVARAVHQKLAGRLPDTYWNPLRERFVAGFAIHDTSQTSVEQAEKFAHSLAEVLQPMTAGKPSMYLEYYGETVKEITAS